MITFASQITKYATNMKRNIITSVALLLVLVTACAHDVSGNDDEALRTWQAGATVSIKAVEKYGMDRCFTSEPIPDAVFERMKGKSYPDGCLVKRSELRYLRVLHIDFEGKTHLGEMVCNESIAADLVDIFRQLYAARYPIERMVLIDNYDAKDEMSMRDNNSSSFCYRVVSGTKTLSKHARGLAVDINTLYNPYVRTRDGKQTVEPATATPYVNRAKKFKYKIEKGDLCYRLFTERGFKWGGNWNTVKDYQHFEK